MKSAFIFALKALGILVGVAILIFILFVTDLIWSARSERNKFDELSKFLKTEKNLQVALSKTNDFGYSSFFIIHPEKPVQSEHEKLKNIDQSISVNLSSKKQLNSALAQIPDGKIIISKPGDTPFAPFRGFFRIDYKSGEVLKVEPGVLD